jgi:ABC-2 type transport system permease protein
MVTVYRFNFGVDAAPAPLGRRDADNTAIPRTERMRNFMARGYRNSQGAADSKSNYRGAVGVAVGISILLNILDAITALGKIRDWLPVHYAFSWFDALATTIDWSVMIRGASYCAISGTILYALAINRFAHKDITS